MYEALDAVGNSPGLTNAQLTPVGDEAVMLMLARLAPELPRVTEPLTPIVLVVDVLGIVTLTWRACTLSVVPFIEGLLVRPLLPRATLAVISVDKAVVLAVLP